MSTLGPLPPTSDEYWKEANVNKHEITKPVLCEHSFVRMTGMEVRCAKCPIGFIVSPLEELKDGHIYRHGSLMI